LPVGGGGGEKTAKLAPPPVGGGGGEKTPKLAPLPVGGGGGEKTPKLTLLPVGGGGGEKTPGFAFFPATPVLAYAIPAENAKRNADAIADLFNRLESITFTSGEYLFGNASED
jgi:hypothetical protein